MGIYRTTMKNSKFQTICTSAFSKQFFVGSRSVFWKSSGKVLYKIQIKLLGAKKINSQKIVTIKRLTLEYFNFHYTPNLNIFQKIPSWSEVAALFEISWKSTMKIPTFTTHQT